MATLQTYSTTTPLDTELEGDGALELRKYSERFKERFELDHNMDGYLDTDLASCDGYHKKVTMAVQSSDPSAMTGAGVLYTKTASGTQGLYFRNSAGIVKIV